SGGFMIYATKMRFRPAAIITLTMLSAFSTTRATEIIKIQGFIKSRSGALMIVQTAENANLPVLLTDSTKVGQVQGVLKARKKDMSMAALIPGLAIRVEGTYDASNQLAAKSVSFKGNDLERAQSIDAGLHETKVRQQQSEESLKKHEAELQAQSDALK